MTDWSGEDESSFCSGFGTTWHEFVGKNLACPESVESSEFVALLRLN